MVSALPYSDEELEKPEYRIDLTESNKTVLCVSLSNSGCWIERLRTKTAWVIYGIC